MSRFYLIEVHPASQVGKSRLMAGTEWKEVMGSSVKYRWVGKEISLSFLSVVDLNGFIQRPVIYASSVAIDRRIHPRN